MNINELRVDVSIRAKNGLNFLLSGLIIWLLITIIYVLPIDVYTKSILLLISSGFMFPLSIILSKMLKTDWKLENNPLGILGLYLNIAQVMYFPLIFLALGKQPEDTIIVFAIITGAHFFPYGWFYHTKAYFLMAPIISLSMMFIGWNVSVNNLWFIPLSMVGFLIILNIWLLIDYKNKLEK